MGRGLRVAEVVPGSVAAELGVVPGDRLIAINGTLLHDLIDYEFHIADDPLVLELLCRAGGRLETEVVRGEGESLGIIFEPPVPKRCGNNCLFCFVHQQPRGLRRSLYVKDEDYRLSFLYGTYITLTNLSRRDLSRIKRQRLSPLYVSVHATDPLVRERLLGRTGLPPVLGLLQELAAEGIVLHTQVVLCPGINDGRVLSRTISELAALHPQVASVAVVPVGLTRYRQRLPKLQPVTPGYAATFVGEWQPEAERLARHLDAPFLFLADEFFTRGNRPFPTLETYGTFPQVENGVGMVPLFLEEAGRVLKTARQLPPSTVTVVTGVSPFAYVEGFAVELSSRIGVTIDVIAVPNRLFGDQVTVTGLVAGRDIVAVLERRGHGELVIMPDVMLTEGEEGRFIDDLTVPEVAEALGCELLVVPASPAGLYGALAKRGVIANR